MRVTNKAQIYGWFEVISSSIKLFFLFIVICFMVAINLGGMFELPFWRIILMPLQLAKSIELLGHSVGNNLYDFI